MKKILLVLVFFIAIGSLFGRELFQLEENTQLAASTTKKRSKKVVKKPTPVEVPAPETKVEPTPETKKVEPKPTTEKPSKISRSLKAGREVHDLAFSIGYNIVETFGRIPYFNAKYDYFFVGSHWYAEGDVGAGYFLRDAEIPLVHEGLYKNDLIINVDFNLGYTFGYSNLGYISGGSNKLTPFVLFGPSLVYQGGFFNPGGLVGFGQIIYPKDKTGYTIHYGVKDRINFPKVYTTKFVTHNIELYIGIQLRLKD